MKTRNQLANFYRMAYETGRMKTGDEAIQAAREFGTTPFLTERPEFCTICAGSLVDQKTARDSAGPHHEDPFQCIENLLRLVEALEQAIDDKRSTELLLRRELEKSPQRKQKGS